MQETRPARRRAVVPLQKILEFAGDGAFATDALRFQRHNPRRNACALQRPHQRDAVADAENGRVGHYQGSEVVARCLVMQWYLLRRSNAERTTFVLAENGEGGEKDPLGGEAEEGEWKLARLTQAKAVEEEG